MMEAVKGYLLSVICAAMACAIVGSLFDKKGSRGALMKLVTGIFLAFTVISPVASIRLEELTLFADDLREEASTAAALGQSMAEESMAALIKSEVEAYILDKAATLSTPLKVEVTLGSDQRPESVKLHGSVSPYAKFRLESILQEDLGIAKENQQWIG